MAYEKREQVVAEAPLDAGQIAMAAFMATGVNDDEWRDETDERGTWEERLVANASQIAGLVHYHRSPLRQAIDAVAGADKSFDCVLESIKKEQTSGRGFLTIRSWPSKDHPDGVETCRTDILSDSPAARSLAIRLRELEGHKVRLFLNLEEITSGRSKGHKVRVVKAVLDLGPASENDFVPRTQD